MFVSDEATILHADLDSFYASVEQRDDPRLRGRPVIVGGGVVLAASYEAKAFGVRTAMGGAAGAAAVPAGDRRAAADGGLLARRARRCSRSSRTPRRWSRGCRSTRPSSTSAGCERIVGHARARSRRGCGATVLEQVGLPITVGVARTKFLAKVASGVAKPDGLLVVPPDGELEFLHPLPVERLWGVGPVTAAKLHERGITHRRRGRAARRGRAGRDARPRRRAGTCTRSRTTATRAACGPAGGGARSARSARSGRAAEVARASSTRRWSRSSTGVDAPHARRRPGRPHGRAAPALRRLHARDPLAHARRGDRRTPTTILAAARGLLVAAHAADRARGHHARRRRARQPRRTTTPSSSRCRSTATARRSTPRSTTCATASARGDHPRRAARPRPRPRDAAAARLTRLSSESRPRAPDSRPRSSPWPTGCRQTWSAPASRCARTASATASAEPCGTTASMSRSLPPSGHVALGEAEPQQVARVVGQPQVGGGEGARLRAAAAPGRGPRRRRARGRASALGPDPLAREARVLDGREVRVRAERPLRGELEHLRPERGDDTLVARHRRLGGVEPVEELAHLRERLLVLARSPPGDRCPTPSRKRSPNSLAQLGVPGRDVRRLVAPDVEDPGRDGERGGRLEARPRLARATGCRRPRARRSRAPRTPRAGPRPSWWRRQIPNCPERHAPQIGTSQLLPAVVPVR